MTDLTLIDAVNAARKIESYLYSLDRANALKNADWGDSGTLNVRRSPLTEVAREVGDFLADIDEVQDVPIERPIVILRDDLSKRGEVRVYFRPSPAGSDSPSMYEAMLFSKSDGILIDSAIGISEEAALSRLEVILR